MFEVRLAASPNTLVASGSDVEFSGAYATFSLENSPLQNNVAYEFRASLSDGVAGSWSPWTSFLVSPSQSVAEPEDLSVANCIAPCDVLTVQTATPEISSASSGRPGQHGFGRVRIAVQWLGCYFGLRSPNRPRQVSL